MSACARCLLSVSLAVAVSLSLPAWSATRTLDDARRSQARFESTAAGYRQAAVRLPGMTTAEKDVLGDMKFVYEHSAAVRVRAVRQFGQRKLVVSDGWMSLVEDLTRAAALATQTNDDRCFYAFTEASIAVARDNLRRAGMVNAEMREVPRLADFVEARSKSSCAGLRPSDLRKQKIEEAVDIGVDAALVWAIGRELAAQVDPRDAKPPASVASAASAALAVLAAASGAASSVQPSASAIEAKAASLELRCRKEVAEIRSLDRAVALHIDLLPAYAAVLGTAWIDQGDGDEDRACKGRMARVQGFFESLAVSRNLPGQAEKVRDLRKRLVDGWAVGSPLSR